MPLLPNFLFLFFFSLFPYSSSFPESICIFHSPYWEPHTFISTHTYTHTVNHHHLVINTQRPQSVPPCPQVQIALFGTEFGIGISRALLPVWPNQWSFFLKYILALKGVPSSRGPSYNNYREEILGWLWNQLSPCYCAWDVGGRKARALGVSALFTWSPWSLEYIPTRYAHSPRTLILHSHLLYKKWGNVKCLYQMNGTRNLRNSTNKEMQSYSGYKIFQGDHKLCLLFCFLFFSHWKYYSLKMPISAVTLLDFTLTRWLRLSFWMDDNPRQRLSPRCQFQGLCVHRLSGQGDTTWYISFVICLFKCHSHWIEPF